MRLPMSCRPLLLHVTSCASFLMDPLLVVLLVVLVVLLVLRGLGLLVGYAKRIWRMLGRQLWR